MLFRSMVQSNKSAETAERLALLFKLFGDQTRLSILTELLDDEMYVGEIVEKLQMSQSAISHQLMILKKGKLVRTRRSGKNIYYSISDSHVEQILRLGKKHINE